MISQSAKTLKVVKRASVLIIVLLAYVLLFVVNVSAASDKVQSGQSDKTFDVAFLQSVKNVLLYEQLVKIVGVPGAKVGHASIKLPGDKYHWSGKEKSSFNIIVISGKVVESNIVMPDSRIISIESNGKMIEYGK